MSNNDPTAAARMKAYRARQKEKGLAYSRGSNKGPSHKTKWQLGNFIALDGEGENTGPIETFQVGEKGKIYHAQEHIYTLLAASSGENIYSKQSRIEAQSAIDFLLDLSYNRKREKPIFVIFAGSYDINHILMFGFPQKFLKYLSRGVTSTWNHQGVDYQIEYRARKSLCIKRGCTEKKNSKGKVIVSWESSITIWDVWGFFQGSFVEVMGKWLGKDHHHYQLITRMKKLRGDFASVAQDEINAYNRAEIECLVEIMQKVHSALQGLGLSCRRWDGAGAVAAAMYLKHDIRKYMGSQAPEHLQEAIRCAYAGGRIEVCKIGNYEGEVYDYDINSAYPAIMYGLPCLACGIWHHENERALAVRPGFTLIHCKFEFPHDLPFYPLFYRTDKMQISYPRTGEGWYWFPEYEAALQCGGNLEVLEYYHFEQKCEHKPFEWIEDYYEKRKQWTKNPTEEWQKGGEKIIKLGLNSLYGKTAQQLGGKLDAPPVYHKMEWAGYITSATRARLFNAAIQSADSIIGFATDGIFSSTELPLALSDKKELGAWELKTPIPKGITIAMAGVYWWHFGEDENGEKNYQHFSRGFDKESMTTPALVLEAWKKGKSEIDIPMHRLIGMGSACASDSLWPMRGRFTTGMRTLRLDGKSHKRMGINVKKIKPHEGLIPLAPNINMEYETGLQGCSHPYPVSWLEEHTEEYENDMELIKENSDMENI